MVAMFVVVAIVLIIKDLLAELEVADLRLAPSVLVVVWLRFHAEVGLTLEVKGFVGSLLVVQIRPLDILYVCRCANDESSCLLHALYGTFHALLPPSCKVLRWTWLARERAPLKKCACLEICKAF